MCQWSSAPTVPPSTPAQKLLSAARSAASNTTTWKVIFTASFSRRRRGTPPSAFNGAHHARRVGDPSRRYARRGHEPHGVTERAPETAPRMAPSDLHHGVADARNSKVESLERHRKAS